MDYTSPKYNIQLLPSYTLWIKTDFATEYLLVSDEDNRILRCISYEKGKPKSEGLKLLSLPFEKIKLIVPESSFIIHPLDIFKENDPSLYEEFLPYNSSAELSLYKSKELNLAVLYAYDAWLISDWKKIFPNSEIIPECAVLLETLQENMEKGFRIYIHELDKKMTFAVLNDEKILLINSFEVREEEDFHFYLLKILKQLDVNPYFDTCTITQQKKDLDLANIASQYAKQVKAVENHLYSEEKDHGFTEIRNLNFRNQL